MILWFYEKEQIKLAESMENHKLSFIYGCLSLDDNHQNSYLLVNGKNVKLKAKQTFSNVLCLCSIRPCFSDKICMDSDVYKICVHNRNLPYNKSKISTSICQKNTMHFFVWVFSSKNLCKFKQWSSWRYWLYFKIFLSISIQIRQKEKFVVY